MHSHCWKRSPVWSDRQFSSSTESARSPIIWLHWTSDGIHWASPRISRSISAFCWLVITLHNAPRSSNLSQRFAIIQIYSWLPTPMVATAMQSASILSSQYSLNGIRWIVSSDITNCTVSIEWYQLDGDQRRQTHFAIVLTRKSFRKTFGKSLSEKSSQRIFTKKPDQSLLSA